MVPMVLNPLTIGFVISGGGFYSYYNLQCIKLDQERKNARKKIVLFIQKTFKAFFKNGFIHIYPAELPLFTCK